MPKTDSSSNRYKALIERIFRDRYRKGMSRVEFERGDLVKIASKLGVDVPKNLGDIIYSLRYRTEMPKFILSTQPTGKEWIIEGIGRAKYAFVLAKRNRILPNNESVTIPIPDSRLSSYEPTRSMMSKRF